MRFQEVRSRRRTSRPNRPSWATPVYRAPTAVEVPRRKVSKLTPGWKERKPSAQPSIILPKAGSPQVTMVPVAVVAGEYAARSGTPMVWAVQLMSSSRLAPRPGRIADLQMRRLDTSSTLAGREGRVHDRARGQGPPDREGRTPVPHEAVHEEGEV